MVHPKGIGLAIARLGFAVNPAEREGMLRSPERFTLLQILSASLFLQKKWYTQSVEPTTRSLSSK